MSVFTPKEVRERLCEECRQTAGGVLGWSRQHGVPKSTVDDVVKGAFIANKVIKAMGLRKIELYLEQYDQCVTLYTDKFDD